MTDNKINKVLKEEESSSVQIINKPLKLEAVNEGHKEDDVLVRGTDNTVKYVPQSELGGGGSQTLQQTLNTGSTASYNTAGVAILQGRDNERNFNLYTFGTSNSNGSILISPGNLQLLASAGIGGFNTIQTNFAVNEGKLNLYTEKKFKRTTLKMIDPVVNTVLNLPAKSIEGTYTLATTDDIPVSGSYDSSINANSTNVNNPGNTFIEKIYYTKIGKNVSCSASVSIHTNADTSTEIAFIQVSLPFPQSSTLPRLNAGNGTLHGGGLGNFFVPAIVQLEGTNNAKIIFAGKSGDNGSFYQGEIHWTYETD